MARILVIDDDEVFLNLMAGALRDCGHDVVLAFDGHAGSQLVRSHSFDVVVCDLVMPGQEGLQTIINLRRDHPDLAIVAVSGGLATTPHLDVLHFASKLGADLTVRKPFRLRQLSEAVDDALKRRTAQIERAHRV